MVYVVSMSECSEQRVTACGEKKTENEASSEQSEDAKRGQLTGSQVLVRVLKGLVWAQMMGHVLISEEHQNWRRDRETESGVM